LQAFDNFMKHHTGPRYRSFCDLVMQTSNILQQPAGMAMPKCINRWSCRAFEPFSTEDITIWGPVQMARSPVNLHNRSGIVVQVMQ